jgi:prefoldin subunit 5
MGKKKDKAEKSKKAKSGKKQAAEPHPDTVEVSERETEEARSGDPTMSPYAELVSTEDVMELVSSLDQNLEQLEKTTQALQQQIARNQQALQRKLTIFEVVALVLVIGIFSVGYNAAKSSTRTTNHVDTVTADIVDMRARIDRINASMDAMSGDMSNLDNKLNALSANAAGINKIVNQLATDVGKINTDNATQPYDPWRTGGYWR